MMTSDGNGVSVSSDCVYSSDDDRGRARGSTKSRLKRLVSSDEDSDSGYVCTRWCIKTYIA